MDEPRLIELLKEQSHLIPPAGNGIFVPPAGDPAAKIAIVGEAPGREEEAARTPFIGDAGKLLNRCLSNINVSRTNTYITNVFKFKPPDVPKKSNDITTFIGTSKTKPNLTPFVKESIRLLIEELKQTDANIVVAAGAMSLYALTGYFDRITKRRGSVYWSEVIGKKVISILHPAYVLRIRFSKDNDWSFLNAVDFKRIQVQSKTPDMVSQKRELYINPTFNEAMDFIRYCNMQPVVNFDLETIVENEEVTHISLSCSPDYAMSISLDAGLYPRYTVEQETELLIAICTLLENPDVRKVIHNTAFEDLIMFRQYGCVIQNTDDTLVAAAIALPSVYRRLEIQTSIFTNEPYYKDEGHGHTSKAKVSDDYSRYSAKDTIVMTEIRQGQWQELARQSNLEAYQRQMKLRIPTLHMGEYGIKVDTVALESERKEVEKEITQLSEQFHQACGDVDFRSPKQLMDYYYIRLGYHTYLNPKTKQPTVDEKALKRLKIKGAPGVAELLKLRTLEAYIKYLNMKLTPEGRMRCTFNIAGTSQARTSSEANVFGEGFNAQNLPQRFRKFIKADDGYVMYELDKEQAENRIVAYIAPDLRMIKAFESDVDIHGETAAIVFDLPYNDVKDIIRIPLNEAIKTYTRITILGDGTKSMRDWGKRAGHGQNYRLGYKLLAVMYEMPESQSRMILERYHTAYPGIKNYHAWMDNQIEKTRVATNLFGRTRVFTENLQLAKQRALSYIPQSTVGELTNQWGLVHVWEGKEYYIIVLLDIVHDSILIEIPKSLPINEHVRLLKSITRSLDQPLRWKDFTFVIPTGVKSGTCWGALEKIDIYQNTDYIVNQITKSLIVNKEIVGGYEVEELITMDESEEN
jgi:uracil-DNA glycosylase family 4